MKKIAVIGSSGAGKSTLSRQLGEMTDLPVYHLDVLHWKQNWVMMSNDEQVRIQSEVVKKPKWIIDGNYGSALDIRLKEADTIIFLDFKRSLCLYRVMKRAYQYRKKQRPDMTKGNREHIDFSFYDWVWRFPKDKRPTIIKKLESLSEEKEVIVLHTPKEVEVFLSKMNEKDEYL